MLRKAFGTHPATSCDPPETGGFAGGQSQGFIFLIGHSNNRQNFITTTGSPFRCTRCRGPASRGGRVATCCGVGVHEKRELQERGMKKRGIKKRGNKFHRCGAKRPVAASAGTRLGYIRTLYLFRRRSKLRACAPQRWSLLPRLTSSAFGSLEMQSSVTKFVPEHTILVSRRGIGSYWGMGFSADLPAPVTCG